MAQNHNNRQKNDNIKQLIKWIINLLGNQDGSVKLKVTLWGENVFKFDAMKVYLYEKINLEDDLKRTNDFNWGTTPYVMSVPDKSQSNIIKMLTDVDFNILDYSNLDDSHESLINVKAKIMAIDLNTTPRRATIKQANGDRENLIFWKNPKDEYHQYLSELKKKCIYLFLGIWQKDAHQEIKDYTAFDSTRIVEIELKKWIKFLKKFWNKDAY